MTSTESRSHAVLSIAPVALVVVVPLFFLPGAFGPFHAAKWLAVCVVVPAGLAVCAALGQLRWPRWQWFVPLVVVSVLATVFGVAPAMSVFGSPNRNDGLLGLALGLGAFVLGASVGGDPTVQRRVLRAAFVTGGVVGALAVADRLGLDMAGLGDAGEVSRARSTWGSATFAAAHLVVVAPLAVAHIRSRDSRWRWVAVACTVAIGAGLLSTGTRAAWLAALLAAVLVYPAWQSGGERSGTQAGGAGRTAVFVGIGAAVVVLVALVVVPQLDRASGAGRLELWGTTPSVIADAALLGSGPDSQRVVLPSGIDADFEVEHGSDELHDRAHSLPLDTLVTTGILGLLALGALVWVLARDVVTSLRRRLVPTALAAGIVAWGFTLLFAFGDPVLDPIPLMLTGLLWVAIVPVSARPGGDKPQGSTSPSEPIRWVGATAFAAVAVAGFLWAGAEVIAEHRLAAAMDLRSVGDIEGALDELDAGATIAPGRFDLDQVASRLVTTSLTSGPEVASGADRAALVDDALDRLDRAQGVAGEDPDILMDRAELLTAAGRAAEAEGVYEVVFGLYPNSFRAHLGAGLAASELDDLDRAESEWTEAAALAPGDARALVNLGILAERRGDPEAAEEFFMRALEVDPDASAAAAGLERVTAED